MVLSMTTNGLVTCVNDRPFIIQSFLIQSAKLLNPSSCSIPQRVSTSNVPRYMQGYRIRLQHMMSCLFYLCTSYWKMYWTLVMGLVKIVNGRCGHINLTLKEGWNSSPIKGSRCLREPKKVYSHCLVLVGSRNGFERDLHKQKLLISYEIN